MDYHAVVDGLGDWFVNRSLDVGMEADMQCRLVERLRDGLRAEGRLWARLPDPPLTDDGNYAQYKRPYIDRISDEVDSGTFSRVRPEVNLSDLDGPNEQFDVVVFEEELDYPVFWNDGSKRYDERDVAAAFELKFVTNQNVLSNDFDAATLRNATAEEMRERAVEHLHVDNRGVQSDIDRLNDLPTDETYFILFSHYNYLFQPPLLDADGTTAEKNRKIGPLVDAWLSAEAANGSTDILYAHPGGATWWGKDG